MSKIQEGDVFDYKLMVELRKRFKKLNKRVEYLEKENSRLYQQNEESSKAYGNLGNKYNDLKAMFTVFLVLIAYFFLSIIWGNYMTYGTFLNY